MAFTRFSICLLCITFGFVNIIFGQDISPFCASRKGVKVDGSFLVNENVFLLANQGGTQWLMKLEPSERKYTFTPASGYPRALKHNDTEFTTGDDNFYIPLLIGAAYVKPRLYWFMSDSYFQFHYSSSEFQPAVKKALIEKDLEFHNISKTRNVTIEHVVVLKVTDDFVLTKFTMDVRVRRRERETWIFRTNVKSEDFKTRTERILVRKENPDKPSNVNDFIKTFASEVLLFGLNDLGKSSYGYAFEGNWSFPVRYDFTGNWATSKLTRKESYTIHTVIDKGHSNQQMHFVSDLDSNRPGYLRTSSTWFGCPYYRFCLDFEVDAIFKEGQEYIIVSGKTYYSTSYLREKLEPFKAKTLTGKYGDNVPTYVDAVMLVDRTTFFFKDLEVFLFQDKSLKRSGRIDSIFRETSKVMTALVLGEKPSHYGYLFQNEGKNSYVKKYEDFSFIKNTQASYLDNRTISQVNKWHPLFVDTVFEDDHKKIVTLVRHFYITQNGSTFFNEQYQDSDKYKLLLRSKYFGCEGPMDKTDEDILNQYEPIARPTPIDINAKLIVKKEQEKARNFTIVLDPEIKTEPTTTGTPKIKVGGSVGVETTSIINPKAVITIVGIGAGLVILGISGGALIFILTRTKKKRKTQSKTSAKSSAMKKLSKASKGKRRRN